MTRVKRWMVWTLALIQLMILIGLAWLYGASDDLPSIARARERAQRAQERYLETKTTATSTANGSTNGAAGPATPATPATHDDHGHPVPSTATRRS